MLRGIMQSSKYKLRMNGAGTGEKERRRAPAERRRGGITSPLRLPAPRGQPELLAAEEVGRRAGHVAPEVAHSCRWAGDGRVGEGGVVGGGRSRSNGLGVARTLLALVPLDVPLDFASTVLGMD